MTTGELLSRPGSTDHLVQFYSNEALLARNVVRFLGEGARSGDRMIVIATPGHTALFRDQLESAGVAVAELVRDGRLQFHDAERTLASFLLDGEPNWTLFDRTVGDAVREARARAGDGGLRGYGEMVDLLWKQGRLAAATRLEGFWNRLVQAERLSLFCAYTVDLLAPGTKSSEVQQILSTHSHFLPARSNSELEAAVHRALKEVLGEEAVSALLPLIAANVWSHVDVPGAARTVLWLRKNLPRYADDVLALARTYYDQGCAPGSSEGIPA